MSRTTQEIEEILAPVILPLGYEIVDIEIAGEGGKRILRIFIDRRADSDIVTTENHQETNKSVTLDDCEKVSIVAGEALDKVSTIEFLRNPYVLEVSSPGIARVLKKPKDFLRFKGKLARVSVFEPINGSRNFVGRIVNFENDVLTLALSDGSEGARIASFTLKSIARARLEPDTEI